MKFKIHLSNDIDLENHITSSKTFYRSKKKKNLVYMTEKCLYLNSKFTCY